MDLAYRSLEHVAAERFDALAQIRAEQLPDLAALRRVYVRRVARMTAGAVALAVGVLMFAYTYGLLAYSLFGTSSGTLPRGELTALLVFVWPVAGVAYVIAWRVAEARAQRVIAAPLERSGYASIDLARLEARDPKRLVGDMASRRETASVALPLMALSFLMPLTLHFVFALVFQIISPEKLFGEREFDGWIAASVAIVGHAHVALAICSWRFAKKMRVMDADELTARKHRDWLRAWGFAALASVLPGALLLAIPPLLVLLTGLAFIPAMYLVMRRKVIAERVTLER